MATLMIQGTTSDAGKSTLVVGLARILTQMGYRVAPFKPQNMALNSAVTEDGGEIGRAQALQAVACGIPAHTDMNPVLLKPNTDVGAQVIIQGKAIGNMNALDYHAYKARAMAAVLESYQRLSDQYDVVLVEGAGSPAEINLRANDIANMGFAEAVDCPVVLVADIDRGGVFAHLVGTLDLLEPSEQARIRGFVINRFRGDISLLQNGLDWLEDYRQRPVLGVLPYLRGLALDAEDAIKAETLVSTRDDALQVCVPVLPRISNHTDFDPLRAHPQVCLNFVALEDTPPPCDLWILPGSKSTRQDLAIFKQYGWDVHLQRHLRYGGKVLGICGGFQMLGQLVKDPEGSEGDAGETRGLGLLDFSTTLALDKHLRNVSGELLINGGKKSIQGYEIHVGECHGPALERPLIRRADGVCDGAVSEDSQIAGCYWHGLFEHPEALEGLLHWAGVKQVELQDHGALRESAIQRLADSMREHLDIDTLLSWMDHPKPSSDPI